MVVAAGFPYHPGDAQVGAIVLESTGDEFGDPVLIVLREIAVGDETATARERDEAKRTESGHAERTRGLRVEPELIVVRPQILGPAVIQ